MIVLFLKLCLTCIPGTNPSPSADMLEVVDEDYSTHRMLSSMYSVSQQKM